MGRPATTPTKLKNGFYLEIRNKGSRTGIKIRRDTKEEMDKAVKDYRRTKDVILLGEYKNGKPIKKK